MLAILGWGSYPEFDLKGRYGSSDYIDFLTLSDIKVPSQGIDRYQRPFVAFPVESKEDGKHVVTCHQRFTDNDKLWVLGGLEGHKKYLWTNDYRVDPDKIRQLIAGTHPHLRIIST